MVDISKAVKKAGGPAAVARDLGVSQQVVCNWIARNRISAGKVIEFEKLTDISRHLLREDIFGKASKAAA